MSDRPDGSKAWVLLTHHLPASPSKTRVKLWRRLQQLGAVGVMNSVYALPNSTQATEDFEWLRSEVVGAGGQAAVFTASCIDGREEREIISQFQQARTRDFKTLKADIHRVSRDLARIRRDKRPVAASGLRALREKVEALKAIDFFPTGAADKVEQQLAALEARQQQRTRSSVDRRGPQIDPAEYQRRTWITRPRPGVDRFASAWLIRRFVDAQAAFQFTTEPDSLPRAIAFDMYDRGFKHEADRCTFEVLAASFGIDDPVVRGIGEIVHDLDLKDDRFKSRHVPTIGALVEGFRVAFPDDQRLLEQGIALFEALYQALQPSHGTARPRQLRPRRKPGRDR